MRAMRSRMISTGRACSRVEGKKTSSAVPQVRARFLGANLGNLTWAPTAR